MNALSDVLWILGTLACLAFAVANFAEAIMEIGRLKAAKRNGVLLADAYWCRREHAAIVLSILCCGVAATLNWFFGHPDDWQFAVRALAGSGISVMLAYLSYSQHRRRQRMTRALRLGGHDIDAPQKVGPYSVEDRQGSTEYREHVA